MCLLWKIKSIQLKKIFNFSFLQFFFWQNKKLFSITTNSACICTYATFSIIFLGIFIQCVAKERPKKRICCFKSFFVTNFLCFLMPRYDVYRKCSIKKFMNMYVFYVHNKWHNDHFTRL